MHRVRMEKNTTSYNLMSTKYIHLGLQVVFAARKKEFQEKLSKDKKLKYHAPTHSQVIHQQSGTMCISNSDRVPLQIVKIKRYTLLHLYGLSDYWLMTANKMQPGLFSEYKLGLFAHFCSFHLWTGNFLICHIFDFAGETLGRLFWGKQLLWKEQTLELQ